MMARIPTETFLQGDPAELTREQIVENLLESGLWPMIRQRPYSVIARPTEKPKSIFISAFDTSPLAPDYDFLLKDMEEDFQWGVNVLKKFTEGKVHLNLDGRYPSVRTLAISKGWRSTVSKVPILQVMWGFRSTTWIPSIRVRWSGRSSHRMWWPLEDCLRPENMIHPWWWLLPDPGWRNLSISRPFGGAAVAPIAGKSAEGRGQQGDQRKCAQRPPD